MESNLDSIDAEGLIASFPHGPMQVAIVHGAPKVKQRPRPRQDGRGVFTPSKQDEEALAWTLKGKFTKLDVPCCAGFIFYVDNKRGSDIDNYIKLAADALTKAGAWADDKLMRAVGARIEYNKERPRTVIILAPLEN